MNKFWCAVLLFPVLLGCLSFQNGDKGLDLGAFKITIPNEWNYQKRQGEDSFIGEITGNDVVIYFDCSGNGYASHLIPTQDEYLNKEQWLRDCPLYKPGVTYTANFNVKNEKVRQMKEKGLTDTALVQVEGDPCFNAKKKISAPTAEQKQKYPKADYVAELTYKDDKAIIPIEIPLTIKNHNFKIDTTVNYIIKTIWPKFSGAGMTGIYIHSRKSKLNFQMSAKNLSAKDQELALKAFKTIVLKDQ